MQEAFANQQQLTAACLDIEKAYNMVWRYRILKILQMHGIKNNIFNFIKNFLHTWTIQVRIANHLSSSRIIENGVPQRSVLSISLLLLAINDVMTNLFNLVKGFLFADDFAICKGRNPLTAQTLLQNSLNNLQKWSLNTGFKFSSSKSVVITFGKRRHHTNIHLSLNGQELKETSTIKLLGLTFDSRLT